MLGDSCVLIPRRIFPAPGVIFEVEHDPLLVPRSRLLGNEDAAMISHPSIVRRDSAKPNPIELRHPGAHQTRAHMVCHLRV